MTAQELKDRLTEEDIKTLLFEMGATISKEDNNEWISDTVCHHGTSQKLYYYKDSQLFNCYTDCGTMDIISVVMNYKGYEPEEFQKAINWICIKLNIDNCEYGFGKIEKISDWEFIKKYKKPKKKKEVKKLVAYDTSILKIFQKWYTEEWIKEGISIETMGKYEIMYSPWQQSIIIPHYDVHNQLIGVRRRAILEEDIEVFGKYTPFVSGWKIYKHSLGQNLFGLNHNLKAIQRKRKIMLVEAEKSVMQADSIYGEDNFTVALCGSNLTSYQKDLILSLGVKEVIIGLDKQYETLDSEECSKWVKHIKEKIISKLSPFMNVYVLWDTNDLLPYKASPTDMGEEVLLQLMKNKIFVPTDG